MNWGRYRRAPGRHQLPRHGVWRTAYGAAPAHPDGRMRGRSRVLSPGSTKGFVRTPSIP